MATPSASHTPGTSVRKRAASAPSAVATAAAAMSALMLSRVPSASRPSGAITGTTPRSSSSCSAATSTCSTSPTKPSSGRRCARSRPPSAPLRPMAGTPWRARPATTPVLTRPRSTIVATSRAGSSVTRTPSWNCVWTPRRSSHWVISGPPPCTSTTRMPARTRAATSSSGAPAPSNVAPPSLMTKVDPGASTARPVVVSRCVVVMGSPLPYPRSVHCGDAPAPHLVVGEPLLSGATPKDPSSVPPHACWRSEREDRGS